MPDISIVLLTRNGLPLLSEVLKAIFAQQLDSSFEVIAVDSGSTDGTRDLLAHYPIQLVQIPPADFNFGGTRGLGYGLAQGEIIVTLSQDAVPADEHWLANLVAPFADSGIAAVRGGQCLPPGRPVFYWERIGRYYSVRPAVRWVAKYGLSFSNVNSAIRKSVWEQNPIGRVEMSEDKFLQQMWSERGYCFVSAPQARVYHGHDYTLHGLILRSENEGLGQRLCGQNYSLLDACGDTLNLPNWQALIHGLISGEIKTRAEMLCPLIRPFFIWKGNHFNVRYRGGD